MHLLSSTTSRRRFVSRSLNQQDCQSYQQQSQDFCDMAAVASGTLFIQSEVSLHLHSASLLDWYQVQALSVTSPWHYQLYGPRKFRVKGAMKGTCPASLPPQATTDWLSRVTVCQTSSPHPDQILSGDMSLSSSRYLAERRCCQEDRMRPLFIWLSYSCSYERLPELRDAFGHEPKLCYNGPAVVEPLELLFGRQFRLCSARHCVQVVSTCWCYMGSLWQVRCVLLTALPQHCSNVPFHSELLAGPLWLVQSWASLLPAGCFIPSGNPLGVGLPVRYSLAGPRRSHTPATDSFGGLIQ